VFCKNTENAQTFPNFDGNWENFPGNFRGFFFSDGFPFSGISGISEIGPNFFEIYIARTKMAHNIAF
jgi:hypothetical protein